MIQGYTDIKQSKILAEILPIESADMFFCNDGSVKLMWEHLKNIPVTTPCWSLAALIELLPPIDNLKPMIDLEGNSIYYSGNNTPCTNGDTLIDACVDIIIKLKELNLLKLK